MQNSYTKIYFYVLWFFNNCKKSYVARHRSPQLNKVSTVQVSDTTGVATCSTVRYHINHIA